MITTGDASVEYNTKNIINGHYTCKTEKTNDNESKDVINLTLENELRPLGIYYTHQKKIDKPIKSDFVSCLVSIHLTIFFNFLNRRTNVTWKFSI